LRVVAINSVGESEAGAVGTFETTGQATPLPAIRLRPHTLVPEGLIH
jgi:hypothetical protein